MTPEHAALLERFRAEVERNIPIPLALSSETSVLMIGALQLAARHPHLPAKTREWIEQTIERMLTIYYHLGLDAHVELVELGQNPANNL